MTLFEPASDIKWNPLSSMQQGKWKGQKNSKFLIRLVKILRSWVFLNVLCFSQHFWGYGYFSRYLPHFKNGLVTVRFSSPSGGHAVRLIEVVVVDSCFRQADDVHILGQLEVLFQVEKAEVVANGWLVVSWK